MHIIRLQAENFKRLKATTITPDGPIVNIMGPNDSGKSSTLDAIWAAIGGKDAVPMEPIRQGEERAVLRLEVGASREQVTYVITRRFSKKDGQSYTTDVTVESPDGGRFPSPQRLLDSLMSSLSFDPLAFTLMSKDQQVQALRKLVPGFDFLKAENLDRMEYTKRTDLNRELKRVQALASAIQVSDKLPDIADEQYLDDELSRAYQENADIEKRVNDRLAAQQRIVELEVEIDRLSVARKDLQAKLSNAEPLPQKIDVGGLTLQISSRRAANVEARETLRQHQLRGTYLTEISLLTDQVGLLTNRLNARDTDRLSAIASANLPVPGLSLSQDGVLLNGVPFEQASKAQQLRAGLAIAMAGDQQLRIALIKDGSLLDMPGRALVASMAAERGFQVWMETVDIGQQPVGFIMTDGTAEAAQ